MAYKNIFKIDLTVLGSEVQVCDPESSPLGASITPVGERGLKSKWGSGEQLLLQVFCASRTRYNFRRAPRPLDAWPEATLALPGWLLPHGFCLRQSPQVVLAYTWTGCPFSPGDDFPGKDGSQKGKTGSGWRRIMHK